MHLIHQSLFFILCWMCQNLLIITSCFHHHMPPLRLNTSNTKFCWTTFISDAMDFWSPLEVCVQCADNVLIVSFEFGWIVSPLYSIKINFLYISFQLLLLLVVLAKVSILWTYTFRKEGHKSPESSLLSTVSKQTPSNHPEHLATTFQELKAFRTS